MVDGNLRGEDRIAGAGNAEDQGRGAAGEMVDTAACSSTPEIDTVEPKKSHGAKLRTRVR